MGMRCLSGPSVPEGTGDFLFSFLHVTSVHIINTHSVFMRSDGIRLDGVFMYLHVYLVMALGIVC